MPFKVQTPNERLTAIGERLADDHETATRSEPDRHMAIADCRCDVARDYRAIQHARRARYSLNAAKIIEAYLTLAALANVYGAEDMRDVVRYLQHQQAHPESAAHAALIAALIAYIESGS